MANFGTDGSQGNYEEWAMLYAQAIWLERWRLRNQAEMILGLFSQQGGRSMQ